MGNCKPQFLLSSGREYFHFSGLTLNLIFLVEIKSDYFYAQKIRKFFQECGIKTTDDDDDDDDDDDSDDGGCAGLFQIILLKIIDEVESDKKIRLCLQSTFLISFAEFKFEK